MIKKILSMQFVTLAMTIIAVVGVLTFFQRKATIRSFSEQQSTLLQFGIDNIQLGLSHGQLTAVKKTLQELQTYSIFEGAIVYDDEMLPLLVIPQTFNVAPSLGEESSIISGKITYERGSLTGDGEVIGHLLLAFTLEPVEAAVRESMVYAFMSGGIILLLASLFSAFHVQKMIRPLGEAVKILEALADGDLTQKLKIKNMTEDEVYRITVAVNKAIDGMHGGVKGSMGRIGKHSDALTSSSETLSKMSRGMAENALQTFLKARSVSESAKQINSHVHGVVQSVDEMKKVCNTIEKTASEASHATRTAVKMTGETDRIMSELGKNNADIDGIIKVITSLSEQTKLLALNASIEAARVGEAGKGFSVVAHEVQELSKETSKATGVIKQKMGSIRNDTATAVEKIEKVGVVIHEVNTLQETISASLAEQSVASTGISENLSMTTNQCYEIVENTTKVAQMATKTAKCADNTEESACKLSKVAIELQSSIHQFKV